MPSSASELGNALEGGQMSFPWKLAVSVPGCVGTAQVLSTRASIPVVRSVNHQQVWAEAELLPGLTQEEKQLVMLWAQIPRTSRPSFPVKGENLTCLHSGPVPGARSGGHIADETGFRTALRHVCPVTSCGFPGGHTGGARAHPEEGSPHHSSVTGPALCVFEGVECWLGDLGASLVTDYIHVLYPTNYTPSGRNNLQTNTFTASKIMQWGHCPRTLQSPQSHHTSCPGCGRQESSHSRDHDP